MSVSAWREGDRLAALEGYGILDTPAERAFSEIVDLVAAILEAPVALVSLVDKDRQWFKARRGLPMDETGLDLSVCARVLRRAGVTVVGDLHDDARFEGMRLEHEGKPVRFYAGAPLVTPEGFPLGALCVLDTEPRPGGLTASQRFALEVLGRQTMAQMELRRVAMVGAAHLALSQETLLLATDAAEVGVWDLDLVTDVLTWSDRTKAMFGFLPDAECSLRDFEAGLHAEDRAGTLAAFEASLDPARRTAYDVEYRTIGARDGVVRWVAAKGRGMFDAEGRCVRAIGTAIDITERREAEQRLRDSERRLAESEAKFRAITDSIDQMVWSTEADGVSDFHNQRWFDYTGVPRGTTDEGAWSQLIHSDDRVRAAAAWARSLESGEVYRIEHRLRHRSGQYRWVLARAQPVRDADGRVVRWYGTSTEIEELVQARDVLARSRRALEQEVARRTAERDQLWRSTQDLLAVVDGDGVFKAANPAWTTMLGWPVHEVVGGFHQDFMHPEDGQASDSILTVALRDRIHQFENRVRHRDGSYRHISWNASPHGGLVYASGRDVTEARAAEAVLAATQAQLRQAQKMEAVGQLTGGIAHDFNNMLSIVIGSLDLLDRRLEPGALRERRYVSAAMEGARRAAQLTQRLLAFARQQPLQPEALDANRLVAGMMDLLRHSVGSAVAIEIVPGAGSWLVHADPNQLENALVNLAVNARDAMADGGRLTIGVGTVLWDARDAARLPGLSAGEYVTIAVTDTGVGMDPAVMAKAFDPFFTTKDVGRGTGLGLSQVYGFVQQSGGTVELVSAPGRGTTVTVYLPRLLGAGAGLDGQVVAVVDTPRGQAAEVVLVVDDQAEVRRMSVEALVSLGYGVLEADGAEAALGVLTAHPEIGLLFTDVMMPGTNGWKLADLARGLRPGLPVLFTTGYVRQSIEGDGLLAPGVHLLGKPFTVAALAAKVRAVLG